MTLKETRRAQIAALMDSDRPETVRFRVEQLNDSFIPCSTWEFESAKEANAMYNVLEQYVRPAYLRKYAVVRF